LPIPRAAFEDAIRAAAIAVDANLKGFAVGFEHRFTAVPAGAEAGPPRPQRDGNEDMARRIEEGFPPAAHDILREGVRRLIDYQDTAYGWLYLERMAAVRDAAGAADDHGALIAEAGRHLALRMSYEDIIRVAQLKTDRQRLARVRAEIGAGEREPVVIVDFFRPGIDELCSILPTGVGACAGRAPAPAPRHLRFQPHPGRHREMARRCVQRGRHRRGAGVRDRPMRRAGQGLRRNLRARPRKS
jgi:indolepyruvate ferredoxin oxidoreductase beta subunit